MSDNIPISEQFHKVAEEWCDAEAAASLLEDTKSSVLSQRMVALGDMAVSKAEMIVKSSVEWTDHIGKMIAARKRANLLKVKMEFLRMRHSEHQSQEANERTMARL